MVQHGHAVPIDLEYHYASVPGTNFSLGIVVPKEWKYMKLESPENLKIELSKESVDEIHAAPWKYCMESKAEDFDHIRDISNASSCES